MFISVLCVLLKVGLSVYIKMVERLQNKFLKWDYCKQYEDSESVVSYHSTNTYIRTCMHTLMYIKNANMQTKSCIAKMYVCECGCV